jgi:Na+/phosphate symporter
MTAKQPSKKAIFGRPMAHFCRRENFFEKPLDNALDLLYIFNIMGWLRLSQTATIPIMNTLIFQNIKKPPPTQPLKKKFFFWAIGPFFSPRKFFEKPLDNALDLLYIFNIMGWLRLSQTANIPIMNTLIFQNIIKPPPTQPLQNFFFQNLKSKQPKWNHQ